VGEERKWFDECDVPAAVVKSPGGVITIESHLQALADIRDDAMGDGKYAAAVAAEISRGKAAGLYVERHEHDFTHRVEMVSNEQLEKIARGEVLEHDNG